VETALVVAAALALAAARARPATRVAVGEEPEGPEVATNGEGA